MSRMTPRARLLRRVQTEPERILWLMLRGRRFAGWKFRRQVPVGAYVADFMCVEADLIVEVDGSQHAGSERDERRDAWLASQGYRVLRIWNRDVMADPEGTGAAIWGALEAQLGRERMLSD